MAEQVNSFIRRFRSLSKHGDVIDVFTSGCCYWFAFILAARFSGSIMYDPVANHFAAAVAGRIYDITGDVTDRYRFSAWRDFPDSPERRRVEAYCVNFTKN